MLKYYIYKTTNLINNMIYVGIHKSKDIENDSYLGSGTRLKPAIEHYGAENFSREILSEFDTKEEAQKEERRVVNKDFIESETTYNMCIGGGGYPSVNSKTRKKMSESAKKRFQDPEQYNILVENRKKNAADPAIMKKISDKVKKAWENPEYKEKMTKVSRKLAQDPEERERRRERTKKLWQDPEYRKKMSQRDTSKSPEHKKKLSEAAKRQWRDPEFRKKFFKGRDPISKTLPCQHCEKHIARDGIRRHEKNCSKNPEAPPKNIPCEYCGDAFHIIGITYHKKFCPQRCQDNHTLTSAE